MPRSRFDEPRPGNPMTGYLLGGLVAGLVAGGVLLGGWLAFRHPNESEAAKHQREVREANPNTLDGPSLGARMLDTNIGKDRR
jgi:hypothetical protein